MIITITIIIMAIIINRHYDHLSSPTSNCYENHHNHNNHLQCGDRYHSNQWNQEFSNNQSKVIQNLGVSV